MKLCTLFMHLILNLRYVNNIFHFPIYMDLQSFWGTELEEKDCGHDI